MPARTCIIALAAAGSAALLSTPADAKAVWVPTLADGMNSACGNAYKHGGTLLAQCGGPTTSQIAVNAEVLKRKDGSDNGLECITDENGAPSVNPDFEPKLTATQCAYSGQTNQVPEEFIAITDHSISLVPKQGWDDHNRQTAIDKQWPGAWGGMGTTNWGGTSGRAMAQAYNSRIGYGTTGGQAEDAPRSTLAQGYISYFFKEDPTEENPATNFSVSKNQFFIGFPGNVRQYLNGCATQKPGKTVSLTNGEPCPEKTVSVGDYKFSILGVLSGSMVNSGAPGFEDMTENWSSPDLKTYRDMANYTTMLYRSTLDVGNIKSDMTVVLKDGTERPFSDFDAPNNGIDIAGGKLKIGALEVVFEPNLSMGQYTLTKEDLSTDLPGGTFPCSGQMDDCTFDYTGFDAAPNSFPLGANTKVKKLGKGCREAAECNSWETFADTKNMDMNAAKSSYAGCTECQNGVATGLDDMPAALKLDVSQVVTMKITMRKSKGCPARPDQPEGDDALGIDGTSWQSLPADHDCPWWYLATKTNNGNTVWAAEEDMIPGGFKSLTTCALNSKDCYLIDFHIPLELDGQRTVLGNVENDYSLGWQKGSFFMYDPEVHTPPLPKSGNDVPESGNDDSEAGKLLLPVSCWLAAFVTVWYMQ